MLTFVYVFEGMYVLYHQGIIICDANATALSAYTNTMFKKKPTELSVYITTGSNITTLSAHTSLYET